MTNVNADSANNTGLPKAHRHYEFGTFDERLAHLCALFEVDPPEITYEDGDVSLTDPLMEWIEVHNVSLDWLFAGSPCAMLRVHSSQKKRESEYLGTIQKLEPEVQNGLLAMMKAVMNHNLPMDEALETLDQVIKEFRGKGKAVKNGPSA